MPWMDGGNNLAQRKEVGNRQSKQILPPFSSNQKRKEIIGFEIGTVQQASTSTFCGRAMELFAQSINHLKKGW